jgi:hypothetical protein
MFRKEEYASGMGQRFSANNVAVKDAQISLRRVECASSMVQRSNDAALEDALIKFTKEECA